MRQRRLRLVERDMEEKRVREDKLLKKKREKDIAKRLDFIAGRKN